MKQLKLKGTFGWGGKRRGSGRPNQTNTVNHMKREIVSLKTPIHISMRLREAVPSLRRPALLKIFRAKLRQARTSGLFVLQFSIQRNHIHIIAEVKDNHTLGLGMRSLAGSFARAIKKFSKLKVKKVFEGRYHLRILKSPTQMRNALEYVLLNTSKHQKVIEHIDHYSSAIWFKNWRKLLGSRFRSLILDDFEFYDSEPSKINEVFEIISRPRSWLATEGWKIGREVRVS